MEKNEYGTKESNPELHGLSEKKQVRKVASDFSQGEIAQMTFDMMVNHKIMESRLEKMENRVNMLTSLLSQKGINIPL